MFAYVKCLFTASLDGLHLQFKNFCVPVWSEQNKKYKYLSTTCPHMFENLQKFVVFIFLIPFR